MNGMLTLVAAVAAWCVVGTAQAAGLSHGEVFSKQVGSITLHDYVSSTGGAAQIVETDRLVVFDVPGNAPQNEEFKAFADSLGKPVEAVVISHAHEHHWLGVDTLFPGVKIYSTQAAAINGDAGKKALEAARVSMGTEMVPYTSVPEVEPLADGSKKLGGVEYEFMSLPDLGASIIALPAGKMVMTHHLGYVGVHVPMPPFEARLAQLQKLKDEGYTWMVSGHGVPAESDLLIDNVAEYYAFVDRTVKESGSAEEAVKRIVARYPEYGLVPLLDAFVPMLMKK